MRELREKDEIIEKFEERIIGIENQLLEMNGILRCRYERLAHLINNKITVIYREK